MSIQGVALSTLISRVTPSLTAFDAVQWALTTTTFLIYIIVWNEYVMGGLTYVWMLTLIDAALPFTFLIVEVAMALAISRDPRAFLLANAGVAVVALAQYAHTYIQARREPADNRDALVVLGRMTRLRIVYLALVGVVAFATWALYDVLRLGQMRLPIALVILTLNIVYLVSAVPYWNQMLSYARGSTALAKL